MLTEATVEEEEHAKALTQRFCDKGIHSAAIYSPSRGVWYVVANADREKVRQVLKGTGLARGAVFATLVTQEDGKAS